MVNNNTLNSIDVLGLSSNTETGSAWSCVCENDLGKKRLISSEYSARPGMLQGYIESTIEEDAKKVDNFVTVKGVEAVGKARGLGRISAISQAGRMVSTEMANYTGVYKLKYKICERRGMKVDWSSSRTLSGTVGDDSTDFYVSVEEAINAARAEAANRWKGI